MNVYLNLIINRSTENEHLPKVFAFNTYFLPWYQRGYDEVCRWTRRDDIFSYDILLVPVHEDSHWTLAIVDFRVKRIKYFDSIGGRNDHCLTMLLNYLAQESEDEKGKQLNLDDLGTDPHSESATAEKHRLLRFVRLKIRRICGSRCSD